MSESIFDSTAFASAMKDVYGPEIAYQINDKVVLLPLFTKDSESWEGLKVKYPVHVGRAHGFMAHGGMGVFPAPVNATLTQTEIGVKWLRGKVLFSKEMQLASASSRGAWAKGNQVQMERMVTDISRERNRMLASGSGTGVLCLIDVAGIDTAAITVDAPGGIAADGYGTRYLQPGMLIAIHNGSVIHCIRTISSITTESATAGAVALNASVSAAEAPNNAYVSRVAKDDIANIVLSADTSYANEPMGLEGIADDGTLVGTFQNVLRSTYTDFKATVISTTALSLDALQQLDDTIDQQSGELVTDFVVHHSMRRVYLASVDATRAFMQTGNGPQTFDLGLTPKGSELKYDGRTMHVDRDVQLGEVIGLNRNYLDHYVLQEGEWATDVGGSVLRWAQNDQDAFEAIWREARNYGTSRPNAHGKLTGITVSNAIRRHVA